MKTTTLFITLLAALPLQAQETYLQTDFNSGIPNEYTNLDLDELPVNNGFNIPVESKWFTNTIYGAEGKAAVSTSRHTFELPTDNWLITPAFEVKSANAIFSWEAKSVHYDLRDGYKIMISTTGSDTECFEELYSVEEESYTWKKHVISLEKYAGKKVHIAILHNSQNKFLLAIDNIYAGEPKDIIFDTDNQTKHFCGNTENAIVKGTFRNFGKNIKISKIVCTSGLNVLTKEMHNVEMKSATKADFNFSIPVTLNTAVPYAVDVITNNGETINILEDSIICSYFPRTLLVEKGTGAGCPACPQLMGYMNELKEEYKDEIVQIEAHSPYFDKATGNQLSYDIYDNGMASSNYPILYFNRNQKLKAGSKPEAQNILKKILNEETVASISAKANFKEGKIAVKAEMLFGKPIDNSKGQYRIGFAILDKHVTLPFNAQRSSITGSNMQEFGFLSSPIEKDLMFFHNVVKGTPSAFKGVINSLPEKIEDNKPYKYEGILELPEKKNTTEGLTVVAFVLDFFNTRVLNTVEINIENDQTGLDKLENSQWEASVNVNHNKCFIQLPNDENFNIYIYDLSGRLVKGINANGNKYSFSTKLLNKGTYIISIHQNGNTLTKKIQID